MASSAEERRNPWLLLESQPGDGTIPAIGDANTIQYILHRTMGDELTVRGSSGQMVRLRLVLRPLRIPVDVLVVSRAVFEAWKNLPNNVISVAAREGKSFTHAA